MKEKYLQQLDQRPEGTDSETSYATDQVEGAGRWATDEAVSHTPRPRQRRKNAPKERPRSEGNSDPAEGRATQEPKQQPKRDAANAPKQRERPRQWTANAPKERTPPAVKERTTKGKARPLTIPASGLYIPRRPTLPQTRPTDRQPQGYAQTGRTSHREAQNSRGASILPVLPGRSL